MGTIIAKHIPAEGGFGLLRMLVLLLLFRLCTGGPRYMRSVYQQFCVIGTFVMLFETGNLLIILRCNP